MPTINHFEHSAPITPEWHRLLTPAMHERSRTPERTLHELKYEQLKRIEGKTSGKSIRV